MPFAARHKTQAEREYAIKAFKSGQKHIMAASGVANKGGGKNHVFHSAALLHMIGWVTEALRAIALLLCFTPVLASRSFQVDAGGVLYTNAAFSNHSAVDEAELSPSLKASGPKSRTRAFWRKLSSNPAFALERFAAMERMRCNRRQA